MRNIVSIFWERFRRDGKVVCSEAEASEYETALREILTAEPTPGPITELRFHGVPIQRSDSKP